MEKKEEIDIRKIVHQKLKLRGFGDLSDKELLGIVLAKGAVSEDAFVQSGRYLKVCGSWDSFCAADLGYLKNELSLSEHQYRLLGAMAELSRRTRCKENGNVEFIKNNLDVERLFRPIIAGLDHEEFWLVCLNISGRIVDKIRIGQGGVDGVMVDIKLLMRRVLDKLAYSIILVHNHPSGKKEPSPADIELTKKIKTAAGLFDVELLDHIIITATDMGSLDDYI